MMLVSYSLTLRNPEGILNSFWTNNIEDSEMFVLLYHSIGFALSTRTAIDFDTYTHTHTHTLSLSFPLSHTHTQ